jgi:hypothetical protein
MGLLRARNRSSERTATAFVSSTKTGRVSVKVLIVSWRSRRLIEQRRRLPGFDVTRGNFWRKWVRTVDQVAKTEEQHCYGMCDGRSQRMGEVKRIRGSG